MLLESRITCFGVPRCQVVASLRSRKSVASGASARLAVTFSFAAVLNVARKRDVWSCLGRTLFFTRRIQNDEVKGVDSKLCNGSFFLVSRVTPACCSQLEFSLSSQAACQPVLSLCPTPQCPRLASAIALCAHISGSSLCSFCRETFMSCASCRVSILKVCRTLHRLQRSKRLTDRPSQCRTRIHTFGCSNFDSRAVLWLAVCDLVIDVG